MQTHGSRCFVHLLGACALAAVLSGCVQPGAAAAAPQAADSAVFTIASGLALPECALHDADRDVYLVSNIHGAPLAKDNNGYISRIAPDGRVLVLKWIEGGRDGAVLHAPKGMAVARGTLYVADIDELRLFDAATGAPKGSITAPGASFLNDVEAAADGRVYVSDSGLKAGANGFDPTGSDAVYVLDGNTLKPWVRDTALAVPNGLLAIDGTLWVASFASPAVLPLDRNGRKGTPVALPQGQLDGIAAIGNEWLVSSWQGAALYRGQPGTGFRAIVNGLKSPGDIGVDAKRRRVLVPEVFENRLRVFALDP